MCSQQTDLFQTLWEEGCECLSCHAVANYVPVSMFCSLVLYLAPLNYSIALFTSAHAGIASNHVRSCFSVIPLPLVRPPLVFMLRIYKHLFYHHIS